MMVRSPFIATLILAAVGSIPYSHADDQTIRWSPYTGTAFDGSPLSGELGRLRVPENRLQPNGKTIEIAFVRYRTANPHPGPPIFFLAGGPGGSGIDGCASPATHPQIRLLEHSDVIGLDQRGTGLGVPDLRHPIFSVDLPLDQVVGRDAEVAAVRRVVRECVDYWADNHVDLSAYNSIESADDLDDLRQALGIPKIVVYGTSYGSHLGIAYLRRHAQCVARAVLMKVEGPDHTFKLPSVVDRHLNTVAAMAAADPTIQSELPDLVGTIRELLAELAKHPVTVVLNRGLPEEVSIVIGADDLRRDLSLMLAETETIAKLPALVGRYRSGDWNELARSSLVYRTIPLDPMGYMMDAASGATSARLIRIEHECGDERYLLRDAMMSPFYPPAMRSTGCRDLGDEFRGSLMCDVPVLFVSGTLDARTPPENVDEIRSGFSQSAHAVVVNTGHDSREWMSPEYRDLFQAFLRGEPVADCTIMLPSIQFEAVR